METSLLDAVNRWLRDRVPQLGFSVVEHEQSASFGNAQVLLQSGELRMRVISDRGLIFVDFGSSAEPDTWFDSAVVIDWLGLSASSGLRGPDPVPVLDAVAELLRACERELREKFGVLHFPIAKGELESVRDARASRLFRFTNQ